MDRSEAIKELTQWRDQMKSHGVPNYGKKLTALDLAIEALGQTESEDCISRQQAVEAIEGVDWYHVNPKGELVHGSTSDEESWYKAEDIYKAIESLPPVTPTERTGEWIEHDPKTKRLAKIYECPFCGDEVIGEKTNFCPNCGAKMKGGTENDGQRHTGSH